MSDQIFPQFANFPGCIQNIVFNLLIAEAPDREIPLRGRTKITGQRSKMRGRF